VGGGSDLMARVMSSHLSEFLGVPVIVVNKPGGTGVVGSLQVAEAAPDGYTVGLLSTAVQTTQYTSETPTDRNSYDYIIGINIEPFTLTVRADAPWQTLEDYINYAKENPGKIKTSSSGASSTDKMIAAALEKKAGIQLTHVPYQGYAPAATAVLSGEVESTTVPIGNVIQLVESGDLRILAISHTERIEKLPDVPTFKEQGIDLEWSGWNGLLGPKGMDSEVLEKWRVAVKHVYEKEEWKEFLKQRNYELFPLEGQDLKDFVDMLDSELSVVIEEAGLMIKK
jgi:tripartite-type tricarboxylate transporter receptor subunit TctC